MLGRWRVLLARCGTRELAHGFGNLAIRNVGEIVDAWMFGATGLRWAEGIQKSAANVDVCA